MPHTGKHVAGPQDVHSARIHSLLTATSLADAGLLILRLGVGATMPQAGLRNVLDFGTTVNFMESGGWRPPKFAAFMVTAAETAGGMACYLVC